MSRTALRWWLAAEPARASVSPTAAKAARFTGAVSAATRAMPPVRRPLDATTTPQVPR